MGTTGPDGDFTPFAHVTAPKAVTYRAIMAAFVTAKERFIVHLRPEDVAAASALPADDLPADLGQLVTWGNLRADPDTSRVTTVEDFLRSRFLYQLTPAGEAAETALAAYDEALGRRAELQAVALSDIHDHLRALRELLTEAELDEPKAHLLLQALAGRFGGLADNARAFMSSLQRTIELTDADPDAFVAYKDRLIGYLERFVRDLVLLGPQIAGAIEEAHAGGIGRLLEAAARREAQDAFPDSGQEGDAAAPGADETAVAVARRLAEWEARWSGLREWFVSTSGRPSQARLLRERARSAIPDLLQVVTELNERRSGRSDRSADYRALAHWFAEAPTDGDRHRLWRAAFALAPARHLTVDGDTLDRRAESPEPAGTRWADAAPIVVSARLRRTGHAERRGGPNTVVDRSAQRRALAVRAAAQAAEIDAARRRLCTGGPTRLSAIGELDPASFALLLGLLGDVLSARRQPGGTVRATSADGSLEITMTPCDDGTATIRTPQGTLTGPEHLVDIRDLTEIDRQEVA